MAVPTADDRRITIQASGSGSPPVRDGPVPERVISVLFDTGLEEWRRGWNRSRGSVPAREVIVSASEPMRGATTTTQVVPNGRLAYTILGAAFSVEQLCSSIKNHISGTGGADVQLIVDNLEPFAADQGTVAARHFIAELRELSTDATMDVVIGCSVNAGTDPALASLFDMADVISGGHPATANHIDRLRRDDPTTFGYLRRHWAEAQRGIEECDRSYPQSKQVHAVLTDPKTTPRTLGATLSGLVTLGALETWSKTVGATRYDLTAYHPERLWDVGLAFASSQATGRYDSSRDDGESVE